MAVTSFLRLGAVFGTQGAGVQELFDMAKGMEASYGGSIRAGLDDMVSDAAAFGEGGLRRFMEDETFKEARGLGEGWLTGANIQRVTGIANAWIGAARDGSTSGYLRAAGSTVSTLGAVIPVPAGPVVAVAGGIISGIAALFGDKDPPPPPELRKCVEESALPTFFNPQAWTALAIAAYAQDPGILEQAKRQSLTIAELLQQERNWFASIDDWTGEVMVRPPPPGARYSTAVPMRRLIDVFGRNTFFPEDDPLRVFFAVDQNRPFFGIPLPTLEAVHRLITRPNFLWCYPHEQETFTRAIGAEDAEARFVSRLRSITSPTDLGWDAHANNADFLVAYVFNAVLSAYFCTVPYGAVTVNEWSAAARRKAVATGVGGFGTSRTSFRTVFFPGTTPVDVLRIMQPYPTVRGWVQDPFYAMTIPEFLQRMKDDAWRLENRVPMPSPGIQYGAGDAVDRPMPMRLTGSRIIPTLVIDRSMFEKRSGAREWSTGTKVALAAGGIALAAGGYFGWRALRNRKG